MDSLPLIKMIAPLLLFLMTLGMGMTLVWTDIKRVVNYPKAIGIGTVNQILILPLVGLLLTLAFQLQPEIAVGLLLLTFCPGGVGSNVSTLLARGDVALSIGLTLISGFLVVFSLPLLMNASLVHFMGVELTQTLPVAQTATRLALMVVLPVALGMLIRRRWPAFAVRSERVVKLGGFTLLTLMLTAILIKEHETLVEYGRQAGDVVVLLCITTMSIGFISSRLFALDRAQSVTISIEVGIQNTMLALVVAGLLDNASLAIPAIIYVVVSSAFLLIIIVWANLGLGRLRSQSS